MSSGIRDVRPSGVRAIDTEMARQAADAISTYEANAAVAHEIARCIRARRRLLMLGMGASHAVGRMVEPFYRSAGVEALALPLSEQLVQPLPTEDRVVLLASQSGESAEIVRWVRENNRSSSSTFGMTLSPNSDLARRIYSMIGCGGPEVAFAGTRSLTVTLAMHLAVLAALGHDCAAALDQLAITQRYDVSTAVRHLRSARALVVSGRLFVGTAEALALGLTELTRMPCLAIEGGQLRHGPMEMLGPDTGVVLIRGDEAASHLIAGLADAAADAGAPVVLLDTSGMERPADARIVSLAASRKAGLAALFALLPLAQRLMVEMAVSRVEDAGTPVRSSKITRKE
ncbi:MAG: SIS domain-containing protein [Rhizobiaceae bacterium]|nr:SIS domain-containing protein [Rhizobiaceae bacterium]